MVLGVLILKHFRVLLSYRRKISLNIKTTLLLTAVFASPKWLLPYNIIFSNKTTPLIHVGPVFGSPKSDLYERILYILYIVIVQECDQILIALAICNPFSSESTNQNIHIKLFTFCDLKFRSRRHKYRH